VLVGVMAASLLVAGAASAKGPKDAGTPIPPGSKDAEKQGGYPALTAEWWTWAIGIFPESPILDETGELCGQGQKGKGKGKVWFLAGSFGGVVERDCEVPKNKTLFIPVFNTLWWTPEDGPTAAAVRILANDNATPADLEMDVFVDGEPLADIFGYRAQSPPGGSDWTVLEGSLANTAFGVSPGVRTVVADGYWVMLRPLSRGDHNVVIHAFVPDLFGEDADFELDVTYNLTVK
jgi:hypothetical protein